MVVITIPSPSSGVMLLGCVCGGGGSEGKANDIVTQRLDVQ